jgi:hypothetical protein
MEQVNIYIGIAVILIGYLATIISIYVKLNIKIVEIAKDVIAQKKEFEAHKLNDKETMEALKLSYKENLEEIKQVFKDYKEENKKDHDEMGTELLNISKNINDFKVELFKDFGKEIKYIKSTKNNKIKNIKAE